MRTTSVTRGHNGNFPFIESEGRCFLRMQLITLEWIIVIVILVGTFGAIAYEVIVTIITMQDVEAERNKPTLTKTISCCPPS